MVTTHVLEESTSTLEDMLMALQVAGWKKEYGPGKDVYILQSLVCVKTLLFSKNFDLAINLHAKYSYVVVGNIFQLLGIKYLL